MGGRAKDNRRILRPALCKPGFIATKGGLIILHPLPPFRNTNNVKHTLTSVTVGSLVILLCNFFISFLTVLYICFRFDGKLPSAFLCWSMRSQRAYAVPSANHLSCKTPHAIHVFFVFVTTHVHHAGNIFCTVCRLALQTCTCSFTYITCLQTFVKLVCKLWKVCRLEYADML